MERLSCEEMIKENRDLAGDYWPQVGHAEDEFQETWETTDTRTASTYLKV